MQSQQFQTCAVTMHRKLVDGLVLICQDKELECFKRLEAAVQLCITGMADLYAILPDRFENGEDEIRFFKNVKPLFAAEREYHQRLYHAAVFSVDNSGIFEHEKRRMEKLLADHDGFVRYYRDGKTHNDILWFRQGEAPYPTTLCMWQWETNPKHTSARDGWVAGVMAVERYIDWLRIKIENRE